MTWYGTADLNFLDDSEYNAIICAVHTYGRMSA